MLAILEFISHILCTPIVAIAEPDATEYKL